MLTDGIFSFPFLVLSSPPSHAAPQRPSPSRALPACAVGTGVGLRYDLDFIVIRLDYGIALHAPYETSRRGWYNIERFSDGNAIHFAIGYPF